MTSKDASKLVAEALSFLAAYDRSNTFETFCDHFLTRFGPTARGIGQSASCPAHD